MIRWAARFPQLVLLVFGVASLLFAALYLLEQRDIKRLLAYSSVEHMGILAIGVSFGVPLALAGVLLHVLAHAAAKGNAFMGAGVMVRKYGTKELDRIRDALARLPWTAPMFLAAVFALAAMPPFGLFRSEFQILAGGMADHRNAAAVALVILVTVAFAGLTAATTWMLFAPSRVEAPGAAAAAVMDRGEPSTWMVTPVIVGRPRCCCSGWPRPATSPATHPGAAELAGAPDDHRGQHRTAIAATRMARRDSRPPRRRRTLRRHLHHPLGRTRNCGHCWWPPPTWTAWLLGSHPQYFSMTRCAKSSIGTSISAGCSTQ